MHISHIAVHNFRSIRHLEMSTGRHVVLLGANNHGKSNVLAALEFALSPAFKLSESDFFAFRGQEDELWVELTFSSLTGQESTTFAKYLSTEGLLRVRKRAKLAGDAAVSSSYHGYVHQPRDWWLRETAYERLSTREALQEAAAAVGELRPLVEEGGRMTKQRLRDFQLSYIEANRDSLAFDVALDEGPLLGVKNVAGGVLPDFYLIPAVRDLSDEMKIKGTSAFGRLLQRAVQDMMERDTRLAAIRTGLEGLVAELNERPSESAVELSGLAWLERGIAQEISDWEVGVSINVNPPDLSTIFELGTEMRVNDGFETTAERKGHGLQRAILFGLVRAWAKTLRQAQAGDTRARKASDSVIFAVEEPELFLHPHAQRALSESLRAISATPEHQVVLCTHSTHFVDLANYRDIGIVEKPTPTFGSSIRQCSVDLFAGADAKASKDRFHMAYWLNPDRAELFFADFVVLVEGETEKAVIPYLAERLGLRHQRVSIIDCGSKHNLPLYIAILNAFRIPYVAVHDEDPIPEEMPPEWTEAKWREKRRTYALNAVIQAAAEAGTGSAHALAPDFERVAGVSRTQGDRKGKPIAALEYLGSLDNAGLPDRLVKLVQACYGVWKPPPEATKFVEQQDLFA